MFLIDDSAPTSVTHPTNFGRGYDESQVRPVNLPAMPFGDAPGQIKLIPRSDWSAIIKERKARKAGLKFLRKRAANGQQMPTLDQNGQGYCWAYSVARCIQYCRAYANLPYQRLSAHAVACKVKNFRDEGGWCGLSAEYARQHGYPSIATWPEKSMSRSNDRPEVWEEAKQNIITEGYYDLSLPVYNQNMMEEQIMTCLLNDIPVAADFSWWGHSVGLIDADEIESGNFTYEGDNSWTDGWGEQGSFSLAGSKKKTMGAVAIAGIRL